MKKNYSIQLEKIGLRPLNTTIKSLTILIALLTSHALLAQNVQYEWTKKFGGSGNEQVNSIATDATGNVYTTGRFGGTADFDPGAGIYNLSASGLSDIFVSKLDASGNFVWAKKFGATLHNLGNDIAIDASGNVYVTGTFRGTVDFDPGTGVSNLTADNSYDAFVLKLNSSGDYVWAKSFGSSYSESGNSIDLDAAGNVYTTGLFRDTVDFDPGTGINNLIADGSRYYIFISKLDTDGNFVWARSFGNSLSNQEDPVISVDENGNVFTSAPFGGTIDFDPGVGTSELTSLSEEEDIFISKLDTDGNFVWAKNIGHVNGEIGVYSIDHDASGNTVVTGGFGGTIDFDPGVGIGNLTSESSDGYVLKLDASGDYVWARLFGGPSIQDGNYIHVDAADNIYVAGRFYGTVTLDIDGVETNIISIQNEDILFLKMDANGNYIWAKGLGGTSRNYGKAITVDASGNVYAAGDFQGLVNFNPGTATNSLSSQGGRDVFIMKLSCAVDISTSLAGSTISANATGATYQWVDCNNGNLPIDGETNSSYSATINGNYAVKVTSGECSNISDCVYIGTADINEKAVTLYQLFPNPTTSKVVITNFQSTISSINILDVTGKILASFTPTSSVIDMSMLPTGIYFIELFEGESKSTHKIIKQ
ncbi:MAG: hypothetical protein COA58_04320 [Bacteroidetes bacterium]|nr:MAG: hypothetical protein COA58_04320 [Bacteroidota bacterium]